MYGYYDRNAPIHVKGYRLQSIAEVQNELSESARRDRKREQNTKPLKCWKSDSYGSAMCGGSSFEAILDAYADYRATKMAMGIYDNHTCW